MNIQNTTGELKNKKWKLRVSSSIAPFKEKAEKALKLTGYNYLLNKNNPVIFLGLYHKNDYLSFIRHKGKRVIAWCGGDIENFKKGYFFGDGQGLWKSKIASHIPWQWIIKKFKADHFCENIQQQEKLAELNVSAKIVPAFWGNVDDFPVSFKPSKIFKIFICGHPGREKEYGLDLVWNLAPQLQDVEFHIYGVNIESNQHNIIGHGIVAEKQFDAEIQEYHSCLRPNKHDGFSDALAKSILLGQWPIAKIEYGLVDSYHDEEDLIRTIKILQKMKRPNFEARNYYLKKFNQYPFLTR